VKVFVVHDGYYDTGDIDSVWSDEAKAESRAAELRAGDGHRGEDDPNWRVLAFSVDQPDGYVRGS
jgi:hypothetical protein